MAKRKKVAIAKTVLTRRAHQIAREAAESGDAASGPSTEEKSEPAEVASVDQDKESTSVTPEPTSFNLLDLKLPPQLTPVVALHKKFGKYHCLVENDNNFRFKAKFEAGGSDSETSSSVEVRVVDPCASSESDSSIPHESLQSPSLTNNKFDLPNKPALDDAEEASNLDFSSQFKEANLPNGELEYAHSHEDSLAAETRPRVDIGSFLNSSNEVQMCSQDVTVHDETFENQIFSMDYDNIPLPPDPPMNNPDDDEVITVVQIVDEYGVANSEVYYDVSNGKYDSPAQDFDVQSPAMVTINDDTDSNSTQSEGLNVELIDKFQENFEKLNVSNISLPPSAPLDSTSMDCSDTNDSEETRTSKDNEGDASERDRSLESSLCRPDPSNTPSSTVSDESTSKVILNNENNPNISTDSSSSSTNGVRRSSRIKTISHLKQKTKGQGLVRTPLKKVLISQAKLRQDESSNDSFQKEIPNIPLPPTPSSPSFIAPLDADLKPVKVKSRWRRSSEMEMGCNSPITSPLVSPSISARLQSIAEYPSSTLSKETDGKETSKGEIIYRSGSDKTIEERLKQFHHLMENDYLCERTISKEAKKMTCDCFLTKEELERGELGCGEDCLNRLLMIECNTRCPVGDRCTNRRFQKNEYASLSVFRTEKKGCGVEATSNIGGTGHRDMGACSLEEFLVPDTEQHRLRGEFLMEYVGEVLNSDQFYKRAQEYSSDKNRHHYFMALKGDAVIDATLKGNISRFINHSCDPNSETQKWTVNGELRIGFFSKRDIAVGEELTFDYQFQRFGKEAQKCYCEASNCRGWIGAEPDDDTEEEDEEEVDEEEEDEEEDDEQNDVTTSKEDVTPKEPSARKEIKGDSPLKVEHRLKSKGEKETTKKTRGRKRKERTKVHSSSDLTQDADIEDDLESLSRTGIKNQSHTLSLSRVMVRAKTRTAQMVLLRLLRDADLPCRRLFLDYRGLRLLAPWCAHASMDFRLEMLQTLERLPVPNKTQVQESRLFAVVERWLGDSGLEDSSDTSPSASPAFIDEITGLPVAVPVKLPKDKEQSSSHSQEKSTKENNVLKEKVADISKQLLERWSSLKEVFKIPKKERIQQMKEHERQANVERRAADSSGARDRYANSHHKDKKRRSSPDSRDRERDRDGRRSSNRLDERVLTAIPAVSKEERRRAFAEAAAAAERRRHQQQQQQQAVAGWGTPHAPFPPWGVTAEFAQNMFGPGGMMGGMMPGLMVGAPTVPECPGMEWAPGPEYGMGPPPGYCGPVSGYPAMPFCLPPAGFMPMGAPGPFGPLPPPGVLPPGALMFPHPAQALPVQPLPTAAPPVEESVPEPVPVTEIRLPSGWRSTQDERGRTYYYHVKRRQPQWVPPTPPPPPSDDEDSSNDEDEMNPLDESIIRTVHGKLVEGVDGVYEVIKNESHRPNGLIPERALLNYKPRKRRLGLVTEMPISPRTDEDKEASKLEIKRYKETKEKLKKRKEKVILAQLKSHKYKRKLKDSRQRTSKELVETLSSDSDTEVELEIAAGPSEETERRIKETFRSTVARVLVQHLNPYRRPDCLRGHITNTNDFKHLARKLTHFVMLKELKHCRSVEELVCNDSVKQKAKEFVRKYMSKFGAVYQRPAEEID